MDKKLLYEAPEAEILVVKFEGNFCASPDSTGGLPSYNGDSVVNQSDAWN